MTIKPIMLEIIPRMPILRGDNLTYPNPLSGMNKSHIFFSMSIVICLYVKRNSANDAAQSAISLPLLIDTNEDVMHDDKLLYDVKLAMTRLIS